MTLFLLGLLLFAVVVLIALFVRAGEEEDKEKPHEDEQQRASSMRPLLLGINYLLADAPDRALRAFIEAARMHGDAAEIYMALGEMFRARGEYMRAVRIHQNLLARPDLDEEQRFRAAWALAQDFHKGGFFDRALRQYERVLQMRPDYAPAVEACLRIREDAGEWDEALKLLDRWQRITNEDASRHRAYLLAQKAWEALGRDAHERAQALAQEALKVDASCALARLVRLRLLLAGREKASLATSLQDWRAHAPQTLAVALAELARTGEEEIRQEVRNWLGACVKNNEAQEDWVLAWLEHEPPADARRDAKAWGFRPKSLRGWLRLLAATREDEDGAFARRWRAQAPDWRCSECGVEVREVRWRCPQCHAWGTMRPLEEEACAQG